MTRADEFDRDGRTIRDGEYAPTLHQGHTPSSDEELGQALDSRAPFAALVDDAGSLLPHQRRLSRWTGGTEGDARTGDRDLGRPVELHRGPDCHELARRLAQVTDAAIPLCLGAGWDPDDQPFALLTPPLGRPLAEQLDDDGLRLLEALIVAGRAIETARPELGAHGALDASAVWVSEAGAATVTDWAVDRDGDARGDAAALGALACRVTYGSPEPSRRARFPAPPELGLVLRKATGARGYADCRALAEDLARALRGGAVRAGRSPLRRVVARWTRRHPYRAIALAAALLCLGFAGGAAAWERYNQVQSERRHEQAELDRSERELLEMRALDGTLTQAVRQERVALDAWRTYYDEVTAPGGWGAAKSKANELQLRKLDLLYDELIDRAQRSAGVLSAVDSLSSTTLARLRPFLVDGRPAEQRGLARERAREVLALLVRAFGERAELDGARARFRERKIIATRHLRLYPLFGALQRAVGSADKAELTRRCAALGDGWAAAGHARVGEAWVAMARSLARLARLPGDEARARLRQLLPVLTSDAALTVHPPANTRLRLQQIDNRPAAYELGEARPISPGTRITLPAGNYLITLDRGTRAVRVPIWLDRGEQRILSPTYPDAFPPGDFVYVNAGALRAGSDDSFGLYRRERVDAPFFVARFEYSLGEAADLAARAPSGAERKAVEGLVRAMQRQHGKLGQRARRKPVHTVSVVQALAVIALLNAQQSRWTYRLPGEAEFEMLARGVCGRRFPWGDRWIEGRANSLGYRPRTGQPALIDETPGDTSIFGVRNLCGNVRARCNHGSAPGRLIVRGGSYGAFGAGGAGFLSRRYGRATRSNPGGSITRAADGLRLVCVARR